MSKSLNRGARCKLTHPNDNVNARIIEIGLGVKVWCGSVLYILILNTNPYRVTPLFQGNDKRLRTVQIKSL